MTHSPRLWRNRLLAAALVLTAAPSSSLPAAPPPSPSPDHPAGWRTDGSGRYPDAAPPIHWQRLARTPLAEFRSAPAKPAGDPATAPAAGAALARARAAFHPAEWLLAGPISPDDPSRAIDLELIPGEAALAPDGGQAVGRPAGPTTWKAAGAGPSKDVDLLEAFGAANRPEKDRLENRAAYACAYVWAPQATEAGIRLDGDRGDVRMWLNGKPASTWEGERHQFAGGWNRLLLKLVRRGRIDQWTFGLGLFPIAGPDLRYDAQNLVWTTPMPGPSYSMPVLAGDRVFVTSEPNDLLCVDKATGRVLWMQSDTLWHAALGSEPPGGAQLSLVRLGRDTIELGANAVLDKTSAESPASWDVPGAKVARAELAPHGSTVRLTLDREAPWKEGETVRVRFPGLKTAGGQPAEARRNSPPSPAGRRGASCCASSCSGR